MSRLHWTVKRFQASTRGPSNPMQIRVFVHVVSICWNSSTYLYDYYARTWSTWFTSNKSSHKVKNKKESRWKYFESSESLATYVIIIFVIWRDSILLIHLVRFKIAVYCFFRLYQFHWLYFEIESFAVKAQIDQVKSGIWASN